MAGCAGATLRGGPSAAPPLPGNGLAAGPGIHRESLPVLAADHPGLRSLGARTILGFAVNWVLMLLGSPAIVLLGRGGRPAT
jgi:hypothetical protein